LSTYGSIIGQSFLAFGRQRHLLYAAAISYYGVISLVPLIAIGLSICGWLLRTEEAGEALGKALSAIFPVKSEIFIGAAKAVSAASPWAFVLYLFGLLWAAAYLFESVERVVNAVCCNGGERAFHMRKLIGLVAALIAGVLLLLSVGLGAAQAAFIHAVQLPSGAWESVDRLISRFAILLPLLTSALMFTLIYKLMPIDCIPWKAALAGGVYAGLFWEFSKWAFSIFVILASKNYGALYGSLANLVIIMLWIHVSAIILILGAHVSRITRERMQPACQLRS
jgi:membrane protein